MELTSVLTCPACGHAERLAMPTAACVFFHECAGCHVLLKPKSGDCCVFCTYGSVPCPPTQGDTVDCCAPPEGVSGRTSASVGRSRTEMTLSVSPRSLVNVASDGAGVLGAIVAALCCAGTPLLVSALAALGLSFLRKDAILWPVMLASLLAALWGFWRGFRLHRKPGPLAFGIAGSVVLACGVIVVHGPAAMPMIYGGAAALIISTVWSVRMRRAQRATLALTNRNRAMV
jgi:hypothetical protein